MLNLSEPISVPTGFSVVSSFGTTTLDTDQSTTFVLQLDATDTGTSSGTVSFGSDDADESPFDFTVQGTVLTPPPVVIVDNGDTGFSTVGEWRRWTGQGYLSDIHESVAGTGADVATWTFSNLLPGEYRVSATWTTYTNRATNAPFTILDDSTSLGTVTVNQARAPSQLLYAGVYWDDLGSSYDISNGTLVVQLADNADGRLNADAIRIERLGAVAGGSSLSQGWGTLTTKTSLESLNELTTSIINVKSDALSAAGRVESLHQWVQHVLPANGPKKLDGLGSPGDFSFAQWPEREDLVDDLLEDLAGELAKLE